MEKNTFAITIGNFNHAVLVCSDSGIFHIKEYPEPDCVPPWILPFKLKACFLLEARVTAHTEPWIERSLPPVCMAQVIAGRQAKPAGLSEKCSKLSRMKKPQECSC